MTNTNAPKPWWDTIALRAEVTDGDGAVDDVQMSLHDAVFGQEGVGAGRTPYASASYYGDITHPTGNLVEFMARVAVRLGAEGSTQTGAVWRLDQAMGGGKSHGLVGLWHLAEHPEDLAGTDLGKQVMATAEDIAGRGNVRADLGRPICVVLDCDNTTASSEDFGPARRLGERFLWRLFDKDGHRYDEFKEHITSKKHIAEALRRVGRPVLILIDEIMDYIRFVAAKDPAGAALDMSFLRPLLDVVNDVPNCTAVVVMIASDADDMALTDEGFGHRKELEGLLTRNARTTAVTGGSDFAQIIQRRLFDQRPAREHTDAIADLYLGHMSGSWDTKVFKKLGAVSQAEFRDQVARCYPFHPNLISLAEDEWAQHAGFQRVRSTIRVFASAAYEQAKRAGNGEWVPGLIDSGDLPLQSHQLRDSLLSSGLVADDKTLANLREIASVDIVDQHNPNRGAARRIDGARSGGWTAENPRAAERIATALFVRSLCPRAGGARGATEAELLAASFVPSSAYGTGDAEAVAAELLETNAGMASVDSIPGSGSRPKRWVVETRKTLGMLTRAEKQAVSQADRDKAITDRAFALASSGPFKKVLYVDGGAVPDQGVTFESARGVLEEAGIDDKHQTRLVILDSRWFSLFNGDDTATRNATEAAMGMGPSPLSVQWASSAVFACANTALRAQARGLASEWLACERVALQPTVQGDKDMLRSAKEAAAEARQQLDKRVRQCYQHVIFLAPKGEYEREVRPLRLRRETQSALSGSDVWEQLHEESKAFNHGEFDRGALIHNLRDNDYGVPLSEVRDSFWSNPHKPLLFEGARELSAAIYQAINENILELVDDAGSTYQVRDHDDIRLGSGSIRLRRATPPPPVSPALADALPPVKPDTTVPPATPGSDPTPPVKHWVLTLTANTGVSPASDHDSLVQLLREIANRIDDGIASKTIQHITQSTQITFAGEQADIDDLRDMAAAAGVTIEARAF